MIQNTFDPETKPLLTPEALHGRRDKAGDVCIITFSYAAVQWALANLSCERVAEIGDPGYRYTIYLTEWKGKKICFYMTMISAAAAASCLEEARCLTGCESYIMFGSSGTLNRKLTDGKLMVPTAAFRDEGLSYHYAPASDYIEMNNWKAVAAFLENRNVPYVTGRTWTTDGLYRETAGNAEKRRQEGCISVEMEASAIQAVCDHHGLSLYNFLFASDCLEAEEWKNELIGTSGEGDMQVKCFQLALELAAEISR